MTPSFSRNQKEHERQLDAIIARYYLAFERGEKPNRGEFESQHPEFNQELQDFFRDLGHLEQAVSPAEGRPALGSEFGDQPIPCQSEQASFIVPITRKRGSDSEPPLDHGLRVTEMWQQREDAASLQLSAIQKPINMADMEQFVLSFPLTDTASKILKDIARERAANEEWQRLSDTLPELPLEKQLSLLDGFSEKLIGTAAAQKAAGEADRLRTKYLFAE